MSVSLVWLYLACTVSNTTSPCDQYRKPAQRSDAVRNWPLTPSSHYIPNCCA
ncbi:hypothetical protein PR002_g1495 [Phytophthora rubi]|uniref:Uncharacterized protein n=1 Tax=Phytophthora rubi TaxID=129364 RepID=A0A6A3NN13_9STRA|nr:hypothetical protein PR002_g1495 [Phytophthora rubi]